MALWADQLPIDVAADDAGAVLADVATLERIWERTRLGVDSAPGADAPLQQLRKVADAEDLSAVDGPATALKQALAGLHAR
jgi:hypothetical protein